MQPTVINESNYSDNLSPAKDPKLAEKITEIAENESPFIPSKGSVSYMDGKQIMGITEEKKEEETPQIPGQYTLAGMEKMDTSILLGIINEDMDLMESMEMLPGKNTNKKLRYIIDAHQRNDLATYVAENMPKEEEQLPIVPLQPVNTAAGEIPINKAFDQEKQIDAFLSKEPLKKEEKSEGKTVIEAFAANKYGLEIPELPRDFSVIKQLFNKFMGITPQITTPRYMEIATKVGLFEKYPDKEVLLKTATVEEINLLLNSN
jgi:hypothetical protein